MLLSMSPWAGLLHLLQTRWPAVVITALVLIAATVLSSLLRKDPLAGIPKVGKGQWDYMHRGGLAIYAEGYHKFRGSVFQAVSARQSKVLVIPPQFLPELKKLPDDVLSPAEALEELLHTRHMGLDLDQPTIPHIVRTALTPALVRLNPVMGEEVQKSIGSEFPSSMNWTETNLNDKLLRIIAITMGRVFIGPELCRDEAYIDAAINYTTELANAVIFLWPVPPWLRSFLASMLPPVWKLHRRIRDHDDYLRPIVQARRKAAENADYEKPDDLLQWIIDLKGRYEAKDDHELAFLQLGLGFAAIHTTTMTALNAFYTLLSMPELVPVLRDEARQVLVESGGVFTSTALQGLKKLDSFNKEVLRFYPSGPAAFSRKVMKPFTLSNGQAIPAGVITEVPSGAMNFDETIHERPYEFDALRSYNLRKGIEVEAAEGKTAEGLGNSQFSSVGNASLTWGYGRHACPGRFTATNEIKMIMATALLEYDMKNVGDYKGRYKNKTLGPVCIPDASKTIMIRKRSTA